MGTMDYDIIKIARCMLESRQDIGYSRQYLSEISGVHINTLEGYEKGKHVPSITAVAKLADALDIGIDEYIGRRLPS